ncbi:hypothetical protein AGMMS49965_23060 [Bacteroidia bacterium]|nr:hypothetical protein AGMMS49965_23060 [Bacteroidia bacterium]
MAVRFLRDVHLALPDGDRYSQSDGLFAAKIPARGVAKQEIQQKHYPVSSRVSRFHQIYRTALRGGAGAGI